MGTVTVDINFDAGFTESKHPRGQPGNAGEFAAKGRSVKAPVAKTGGRLGGQPSATHEHLPVKVVGGKRMAANGGDLPAHIQSLRLPPAWKNVTYNPNPNGTLLATGHDVAGRRQYVYSPRFAGQQAEAKFHRIHELDNKFDLIKQQNDKARASRDPRTRDLGDATHLIMQTGIRPGSDIDTLAKEKAYGATTLEGRHVVKTKEGGTSLQFVGKKGVRLNIPVPDARTAKMLRTRAEAAGPTGKLFGAINERLLSQHVGAFGGGGFHTKDFRTLVGTRTARDEVRAMPAPTDEKSYKKAVMAVAKTVSNKLGNTPTIALQAYISPTVFAQWRHTAHV